jgi:hypothetical protein
MRARWLVCAAALAFFGYGISACTAITLAEWSGYTDGSDGGHGTNPGQADSACNPTFLSSLSQCGACMNTNCANEIGAVCTIDAGNSTSWADEYILVCAETPQVNSLECNTFLKAPDASISPGTDPDALKSNVKQCIKGSCYNDCRRCTVTYPGCNGKSVTLGTEGTPCGDCIVSQCAVPLANACGDLFVDPVAACARSVTSCNGQADCTQLKAGGGTSASANSKLVYQCVVNNCADQCK